VGQTSFAFTNAIRVKALNYDHYVQLAHSGAKILVDPWLHGKLTFAGQNWFFEGDKPGLRKNEGQFDIEALTEDVDFILLCQSLNDHTHKPTLEVLPKHIPIVAQPEAADIARSLGFKTVHALNHGQQVCTSPKLGARQSWSALSHCQKIQMHIGNRGKMQMHIGNRPFLPPSEQLGVLSTHIHICLGSSCDGASTYNAFSCLQMSLLDGWLQVQALVGARVGPPWSKRQNGWHFREAGGVSVYYEPHASHDLSSVRTVAPVDVAIVPTTSAYVAGALRMSWGRGLRGAHALQEACT
jgi:Beta-lactamase superfamily domain